MRPSQLHVGGTLYWVIRTRDPDTMLLKDADSDPTVAVRKNGSSVGDSVTVTKRSATTGIYDCSYNPASEAEGDSFTLEESATVTGTTTGSATYSSSFAVRVVAVERGTDSANTTAPDNASAAAAAASAASADTKLSSGRLSRIDRLPDIVAGGSGGLAIVGSEMALPNATLTALFADADVAALIASITAMFDGAGDLPIQTIAAQSAAATVAAIVANGSIMTLLSDASDAAAAAESVDGKLTGGRLSKLDSLTFTSPGVVDAAATVTVAAGDIRDALGMVAADMDDQLDAILSASGGGEGGSDEILDAVTATNARLDIIAAKTNLINAGRLRVLSRVAGNVITAHAGDDHLLLAENALTLEVDDDDASLYALLTDAGNLNVKFGAGRASDTDADEISATIPAANVRHVGTSTFVDIELPSATTAGRRGEYEFDIQITTAAGYKITPQQLQGTLMIEVDRQS